MQSKAAIIIYRVDDLFDLQYLTYRVRNHKMSIHLYLFSSDRVGTDNFTRCHQYVLSDV